MINILIKRKGENLTLSIPHQISSKGGQRCAGESELAKRGLLNGLYGNVAGIVLKYLHPDTMGKSFIL